MVDPFYSQGFIPEHAEARRVMHPYQSELEAVCDEILRSPCEYVNVIAPMLGGKTTFLHRLRERLDQQPERTVVCVLISFEYLGQQPDEQDITQTIWEPVREAVQANPTCVRPTAFPLPRKEEVTDFNELKSCLKKLGTEMDSNAVIVLMLDDVDAISDHKNAILRFFRSLHGSRAEENMSRMPVVLAANQSPQITSLGAVSPYNVARDIYLRDLDIQNTRHFLRRAESYLDSAKFSDEGIAYLYKQTNGQLAMIQEICERVLAESAGRELLDTRDILTGIASLLERPGRVFPTLLDMSPLDPDAQAIMGRLIGSEPVLPFAFRSGVNSLLSRGLAVIGECNRCVIRSPLLQAILVKAYAEFQTMPTLNLTEHQLFRLPQVQSLLVNTELAADTIRFVSQKLPQIQGYSLHQVVELATNHAYELIEGRNPPFDYVGTCFFYQRYYGNDGGVDDPPAIEAVYRLAAKIFAYWSIH